MKRWLLFGGTLTPVNSRAVFFGGWESGSVSSRVMDYIDISSAGNAASFGNMGVGGEANTATISNAVFGAAAGGTTNGGFTLDQNTQAISFATLGNTSFGYTLATPRQSAAGCGNATRAIVAGGTNLGISAVYSSMEYFDWPMLSSSYAAFGNLTLARAFLGSAASTTRGIWIGGLPAGATSSYDTIDYVTIASTANAASFGSDVSPRSSIASCSDHTKMLTATGSNQTGGVFTTGISSVTMATTGNATSFASITTAVNGPAAVSNKTRAVIGGGIDSGSSIHTSMDYVTFASGGSSTSFGNLTVARYGVSGASAGHGGL